MAARSAAVVLQGSLKFPSRAHFFGIFLNEQLKEMEISTLASAILPLKMRDSYLVVMVPSSKKIHVAAGM